MKIAISLLLILVTSSISSFGGENGGDKKEAVSLKLLVLDAETEDPVPAAKVKIGQNKVEAYTDFDGFVEFTNLTQGEYDIEISFVSYEKKHFQDVRIDRSKSRLVLKL